MIPSPLSILLTPGYRGDALTDPEHNMALTDHQKDLITRYKSSYNNGLSTQEASERRSDGLNTVTP